MNMTEVELPILGEPLSVEKFHVSEFNVRAGRAFGESEERAHQKENT